MYSTILVPVDLNEESSWKKALPTAVEYAKLFGARLHVMTVVPDLRKTFAAQLFFPPDFEKKELAEAEKRLRDLVTKFVPKELTVERSVALGTIYHEIVETGKRIDADLIVMQSHRPGAQDYLIGPNAARVLRHFNRSVLAVRD